MLSRAAVVAGVITVDFGALGDVDELLDIERAAFASDRIGRAEFEELTRNAEVAVLIARYGSVGAGALVLKRIGAEMECDAYLYSLGIVPEFRRLGIGFALLAQAAALGSQWRASRIVLEVRPDNLGAIAFYQGAGFVAIGRRAGWYEDGAPGLRLARALPNKLTLSPANEAGK